MTPSKHREDRDLVAEALVRAAAPGSQLVTPPGSRLTPLARDLAFDKGITFTTGRYAEPAGPVGPGGFRRRSNRIAVASDHGGFALKDQLIPLLKEMGERPVDLGPAAASPSVDYPDFARLVAAEVSGGRADFGIIVDGAGIGSAMVANKLPGVKAANCWNEASARNAREHNHANVLTLGSGHLDLAAARLVIAAFLTTDPGDDRHARRAKKLDAVEAEYLRTSQITAHFEEGR
ncbi:Putative sugar phosphate isomerase YwlF [Planctomycetes bacterium Poly30]|uniref:Sugar phosphate isomerase YwlF n=1 Tax=Saltatorellus ferox TaxID=2528018 RepID=A0A518EYG0_9BACT|nr:Putative sugar phosphate isomerase YwlF [Planctomycetes bacterium Poly30]